MISPSWQSNWIETLDPDFFSFSISAFYLKCLVTSTDSLLCTHSYTHLYSLSTSKGLRILGYTYWLHCYQLFILHPFEIWLCLPPLTGIILAKATKTSYVLKTRIFSGLTLLEPFGTSHVIDHSHLPKFCGLESSFSLRFTISVWSLVLLTLHTFCRVFYHPWCLKSAIFHLR